ncbi:DUF4649 family protein [Streptococcus dentapri]|uniref:DUF4649 family protein n=1 Tax=Streptococcus dentapri TaxID=573564 RepID=A0ABV8D147_9STRE
MIEMTYKDAYNIERKQIFENPNDFIQLLTGCLTIPDYYPITSLTYKGKELGFQGSIGDLFKNYLDFEWSSIGD